ncbi:GntR family transcriptional regulator [Microvirga sp. BT689]|uniref:GntR family transcriptional regulator n=1 Tax=Microvirga arvi TaxID=2778731 RepID=UPI00194F026F|nr:GntR family transcriptional regulator [Microvirga arvi]MBM6583700.1 GntR family transcriptional regulator [Microvirga arvi]
MKQEGMLVDKLHMRARQEPEKKPSLVEDAYKALKDAIRNNVFPPGYQGSEQEIALRLGMSRTPVHEAIIRLQEDGLVRVLSKRGVTVCPLAPEDIREIYEVIIAIEAMASELLAALPDEERQLVADELEEATSDMEQALRDDDLLAWAAADDLFHRTLVERCGNSRIRRIAQTLTDQAHRARMLTLKLRSKPTGSIAAHRDIIAAIRKGKAAEAHQQARQHRISARDELVPLIVSVGIKHL